MHRPYTSPSAKTVHCQSAKYLVFTGILSCLLIVTESCKKSNSGGGGYGDSPAKPVTTNAVYQQVTLVADTAGFGAARTDTSLNNAWGIAIDPSGGLHIASNHKGLAVTYDRNGNQMAPVVDIPLHGDRTGSSPSGVVYNSTTDFKNMKLIFVTEDGLISGWNNGDTATTLVDRSSANTVYKGVAIASDGGSNFLYATDFHNNQIDVYSSTLGIVSSKTFNDPTIPAGFAPFNIRNINGLLYVTYAMQKAPDNKDDTSGVGRGYVDVYKPNGTLIKRFASQGTLNSPWGIAQVGDNNGFGQVKGAILIGNFGDGFINVYDSTGNFINKLQSVNGSAVMIKGLWDITFPVNGQPNGDPNTLFFTAGPDKEMHGLFGYLQKK